MNTDAASFVHTLAQDILFKEAAAALWNGKAISVDGIVGSSHALAIAALFQYGTGSLLVVAPNEAAAGNIAGDIALFHQMENIILFPSLEQHDDESKNALAIADESFGERLSVLKRLQNNSGQPFVVVTTMDALQQPVLPPELLAERTQNLTVNSRVDLEFLRQFLIEGGYHSSSAVDLPGEFAVRGYILDLFAPDWDQPVRIEFFNDEIESIRRFDIVTQRSLEQMTQIDLTRLLPNEAVGASLLDYLPPSAPIILIEPQTQLLNHNILLSEKAKASGK